MGQTRVELPCANSSFLSANVIDAIVTQYNNTVEIYGFPINLYIPVNADKQQFDVYMQEPQLKYKGPYETKAFVVWNPSMKQLRNFGIFTEEDVPLVVWMKTRDDLPLITQQSFFEMTMGYGDVATKEYFELVTQVIKNAYNRVVVTAWTAAPLRKSLKNAVIESV